MGGDPVVFDYIMSEKFGLDWKTYDAERINLLVLTHIEYGREAERQQKKQERAAKAKRR